jgi:hypothetical protein
MAVSFEGLAPAIKQIMLRHMAEAPRAAKQFAQASSHALPAGIKPAQALQLSAGGGTKTFPKGIQVGANKPPSGPSAGKPLTPRQLGIRSGLLPFEKSIARPKREYGFTAEQLRSISPHELGLRVALGVGG